MTHIIEGSHPVVLKYSYKMKNTPVEVRPWLAIVPVRIVEI
jgi:hypothetical protein